MSIQLNQNSIHIYDINSLIVTCGAGKNGNYSECLTHYKLQTELELKWNTNIRAVDDAETKFIICYIIDSICYNPSISILLLC